MPRAPNLLWIVTTQWRAQATGYAGDPNVRTPHLDALALEGINFAQAVTPHPFGPFARAALLTGVPSPENGIRNYFDPLPPATRTIAHALNDRGYDTAFLGKWHLGKRDPAAPLVGEEHAKVIVPPDARGGFAFWEGFESGFLLNNPWLHGTRLPEPTQFQGYQSDVIVDRFTTWQQARRSAASPWFAVVSLEPPHPPYDAPAPCSPRNPEEIVLAPNVPQYGKEEEKARRELSGYAAHIVSTDRAIGRLVASVPLDTIVAFTSVHGDMHGAHGLFRKGWPHEESVRVPLLVRGAPSSKNLCGTSDEPVSLLDLPAMTLAWAGGRPWSCKSGHADISMPSVVALPYQCDRAWSGWRTPKRKRVFKADGSLWLEFDLATDPFEMRNLATLGPTG